MNTPFLSFSLLQSYGISYVVSFLFQYIKSFVFYAIIYGFLLSTIPSTTMAQDKTSLPNPIIFCTQVPQAADFTTLMSTFGNHKGTPESAPRGGDLWIWYPDGSLKNLTQAAAYGNTGDAFGDALQQGETAIAVRDPHVHWDGNKVLFSMVIGHAIERYEYRNYYWQIYELTGLGKNDTPVITKVPRQPEQYNNITPIYDTNDRIIFTSDRPRNGQRHLYPQQDEYESSPTVTGLWRFDPMACGNALSLLTHAPSGDFTPIIDSYGRIIFTRWDHLQRDQQAAADIGEGTVYGTFDFKDECADATKIDTTIEFFPEHLANQLNISPAYVNSLRINLFQPWQLNADGTELETLNHIGRHELSSYFEPSFNNDPALSEHYDVFATNSNSITNLFHIVENPTVAGQYYGTNAGEFGSHSAGQIVRLEAPPTLAADAIQVTDITHPDTEEPSDNPSPNHSGFYRDPLVLADGTLIAVHTAETRHDEEIGTSPFTQSRYDFRLKILTETNGYWTADSPLFPNPITKSVSYYNPDNIVQYSGDLWETFPVEVRSRNRPTVTTEHLPSIEAAVFATENVALANFKRFLTHNNLALIVSHDVTSRDQADRQQPFNLKIFGSNTQTIATNSTGNIYEVAYLQIFQGDQVRGIGGIQNPNAGRRVIAQPLHDVNALHYNLPNSGPAGSVTLANDGSMAALVPAGRSLSWQLTKNDGEPVVRERVWLSFQQGEVRVCRSCHGENSVNQAGLPAPNNTPNALTELLQHLKTIDSDGDGIVDLEDAFPHDASLTEENLTEFKENFEGNQEDWQIINEDADGIAWKSKSNVACHQQVMMINNRFEDKANTSDQLVYTIDLSSFTNTTLTFELAYARYNTTLFDALNVHLINCSGNSTTVYSQSGANLATVADDNSGQFAPNSCSDWRTETVNLSAFDGEMVDIVFENVSGFGNPLYLDEIALRSTTPPLNLQAKLWLSGVYKENTQQMEVSTAFRNQIPLTQPFNTAPWNYSGTETVSNIPDEAVDWVYVELRAATNPQMVIAQRAGILLENGLLSDVNGQTNGINFYNIAPNTPYFVVVRTRHHAAIMSAQAIQLPNGGVYDFTMPIHVMGTQQLQPLANATTFGLVAGDINQDGIISVSDFNELQTSLMNQMDYSASDINMDGVLTVVDYNAYLPNASFIGNQLIRY